MTRKKALGELIAAVEAGELDFHGHRDFIPLSGKEAILAFTAYHGSLDAAKSLHEAVLPDEGWHVEWVAKYPGLALKPAAWCASVGWGTRYAAYAENPARAWLLAILKALHAMEPDE